MNFKSVLFILIGLAFSSKVWSQNTIDKSAIDSLSNLMSDLRKAKSDEEKETKSLLFKTQLQRFIDQDGVMDMLISIKTLGVIDSPDKAIRLFTWNVEWEDLTQHYECLILRRDERSGDVLKYELTDASLILEERPEEILTEDKWYGALYYQIVPFEKGNKDMYLVIGFDGFTSMSNRKILDVMYFSGNRVKLGSPVFREGKTLQKRKFYEYAENAVMTLRYEEARNRIIMDHLSPESPTLKGFYAYYVPDMSYDAFLFNRGKWELKEDIIAVNDKGNDKVEVYVEGKDGKPVVKKIKNRWEDPSDGDAPAGGNVHVAEQPEDVLEDKKSKKTRNGWFSAEKRKQRKDKKKGKSNIYPLGK